MKDTLHLNEDQFINLRDQFHYPSLIVPLISGLIFDASGIRPGLVIFFTIMIIGLGF